MSLASAAIAPATLSTYMPTDHEPVLAPELAALLAPEPGQTAVDCTFGGGGHARLIAERLGAAGMLV
ncbi:MAG TPA: 16S rRNA (cytosine(1402)-N(4))-methyltransferase, partial [Solirubrobacterales bacterium]|nr:16S rRNA (cytosine(1402)-N(4))-methyltransferase [Solirubrobacterales bacterium]